MKKILEAHKFATGYGTDKYLVEYEGDWTDLELITAVDNRCYNNPTEEELKRINHYGGYVNRYSDGMKAEVGVYYD